MAVYFKEEFNSTKQEEEEDEEEEKDSIVKACKLILLGLFNINLKYLQTLDMKCSKMSSVEPTSKTDLSWPFKNIGSQTIEIG